MIVVILLIIAILLIITKETLSWSYILQLKEYRRDKLREFFKSPQGKANLLNKKYIIRAVLIFALFFAIGLTDTTSLRKYLSAQTLAFTIAGIIIIDSGRHTYALLCTTSKTHYTKRMIIITAITALLLIGITAYILLIAHYEIYNTDRDEFSLNSYGIIKEYILPFYALCIIPRLPLLIGHLLVLPLSIYQKKKTLRQAQSYIAQQGRTTIAISGSYGKSSVKMFLAALLGSQYPVISTPGNVNTEIGISQFILASSNFSTLEFLKQREDTKTLKYQNTKTLFICEMGTYAIGETKIIGEIVNHHYGFLTGLNNQHVDLFGSLTNAITAESEILINLRRLNGTIYANRDDALVRSVSFAGVQLVRYSITNPNADAFSDSINGQPGAYTFSFHYKRQIYEFQTDVVGRHNILNLTGVIACALDQGVAIKHIQEIMKSIGQYQKTLTISSLPQFQNSKTLKFQIIDDSYNMNQDGVKAGLDLLSEYQTKKIAVLDEIIELGKESEQTHRQIGQTLSQYDLDLIVLTGENYSDWIAQSYSGTAPLIQSSLLGTEYCLQEIKKFHEATTIVFLGRGTKNLLQSLYK